MYECNLESSLLSNIFTEKDFILQLFREWQKNSQIQIYTIPQENNAKGC